MKDLYILETRELGQAKETFLLILSKESALITWRCKFRLLATLDIGTP